MKFPRQIRRDIFSHDSIRKNPFVTGGPILLRQRFSDISRDYYGFLLQLKAISDGFQEWRYSYESTTLHYQEWFALAFIESVKFSANSVRRRHSIEAL